jgi:predicted Zn finger-like uncharacterized protein
MHSELGFGGNKMIAACPKCRTRYQVEEARIPKDGIRLKCQRCDGVFRVVLPTQQPETAAPAPQPVQAPVPAPPAPVPLNVSSPNLRRTVPQAEPEEVLDREKLVLVADPNVEVGKRTVDTLRSWGLSAILTHDGVEAILEVQRKLPAVVVIDAMLPRMYGFQVCELMKRNESLREIKVVLVGEVHDQSRYRRPAHDLYGADAYVEHPDMPGGLESHLREFGLPVQVPASHRESLTMQGTPGITSPSAQSIPTPVPEPMAPPVPVAPPPPAPMAPPAPPVVPQTPVARMETLPDASQVVLGVDPSANLASLATEVPDDGFADQLAKAERLARIIISDVVLYNEDLFGQAVASGDVLPMMERELAEGRAMFQQRIDERIREKRDFLADELIRVAAQRKVSA